MQAMLANQSSDSRSSAVMKAMSPPMESLGTVTVRSQSG